MTRQALVRILLALLLLVTQQMATTHVLSHLSAQALTAQGQPGQADELSSAVAQEQSCHQCIAFAQLGAPLGAQQFAFMAPAGGIIDGGPPDLPAAGAQTILAFQSRGPPQA